MGNLITASNGREFLIGKPGEYSSTNASESGGGYVPGRTLILKGSKLYEDSNYTITPYTEKTVLIKRSATLCLCSINGNSLYIFTINRNEEGKEFITTSKTFKKDFNDSEIAVTAEFERKVEDYEKKQQQIEADALKQKETDRINAEAIARKTEVKSRLLEVQAEIQKLSSNRKADDIMKDSLLQTMLSG